MKSIGKVELQGKNITGIGKIQRKEDDVAKQ